MCVVLLTYWLSFKNFHRERFSEKKKFNYSLRLKNKILYYYCDSANVYSKLFSPRHFVFKMLWRLLLAQLCIQLLKYP